MTSIHKFDVKCPGQSPYATYSTTGVIYMNLLTVKHVWSGTYCVTWEVREHNGADLMNTGYIIMNKSTVLKQIQYRVMSMVDNALLFLDNYSHEYSCTLHTCT